MKSNAKAKPFLFTATRSQPNEQWEATQLSVSLYDVNAPNRPLITFHAYWYSGGQNQGHWVGYEARTPAFEQEQGECPLGGSQQQLRRICDFSAAFYRAFFNRRSDADNSKMIGNHIPVNHLPAEGFAILRQVADYARIDRRIDARGVATRPDAIAMPEAIGWAPKPNGWNDGRNALAPAGDEPAARLAILTRWSDCAGGDEYEARALNAWIEAGRPIRPLVDAGIEGAESADEAIGAPAELLHHAA